MTPDALADLRARILGRVMVNDSGCWIWQRSTALRGYGQIRFRSMQMSAHKAAYLAFNGPIPDGLILCHTCDVRACVNPSHLYAGTYSDNRRDMLERSDWTHPYGKRDACSNGHSYALGYRIAKDGSRVCRTCMRQHMRNFRQRNTK